MKAVLYICVCFTAFSSLLQTQAKSRVPTNKAPSSTPEARLVINIPETRFGGNPPMQGAVIRDHPLHFFKVITENTSNHDLDFFVAGNSWGDAALNFEMQVPDGKITPLTPGMRDYSKNIPTTVHLHPGQVYIREVSLTDGSYTGLSQFIASIPGREVEFKVRARLTQATYKDAADKSMWSGSVVSEWYPIHFQRL